MKKKLTTTLILSLLVVLAGAGLAVADEYADAIRRFESSPEVQTFFKNCYAYAIFPTVGKAAFVVGGRFRGGQGLSTGQGDRQSPADACLLRVTAWGQGVQRDRIFAGQAGLRRIHRRGIRVRRFHVGHRGYGRSRSQGRYGRQNGRGHGRSQYQRPGQDGIPQRHGSFRSPEGWLDGRLVRGRAEIPF